jgi:NADH-quinone oxidoreductase subunit M
MAWMFFIAGMSSLALPGLASFISEVLVLVGAYQTYPVAAIISTLAIVLAALYILIVVQRSLHGPIASGNESLPDLTTRERVAIAPVIAIIIFLGFVPSVLLNVINPTVSHTLMQVNAIDPTPTAGE